MKSLAHGFRWAHNTARLLSRKSNIQVMADLVEEQLDLGIKGDQLKDYPFPAEFFTLDVARKMAGQDRYTRIVKLMEMLDRLWENPNSCGVGYGKSALIDSTPFRDKGDK